MIDPITLLHTLIITAEEILNQLQLDNKDKETGANISKFIRLLIKRELDQLENQLLQKSLKTYEDKSTF